MKQKHKIAFYLALLTTGLAQGQQDTTQYLFKNAHYSYIQYSFGYSPLFFGNGQTGQGFSASLIGVVFNDKLALGLDFDGFVDNTGLIGNTFPQITSYVAVSLNIEPLFRPKKLINFSLPLKIGYAGGSMYDYTWPTIVNLRTSEFMAIQPGVVGWINLLKPLSLGVGGAYRIPFAKSQHDYELYSGFSGYAMVRFKFYTREFNQKMLERQREMMQQGAK